MRGLKFNFFLSILLIANTAFSTENLFYEEEGTRHCHDPWTFRIETAGYFGQFIGYDFNYGEIGLFIAPPQRGNLFFFTDIRGYVLKEDYAAANVGCGIRWQDERFGAIWGANLYYDYLKAGHGHFNQVGLGLESLGSCFDVRINAYLPINDSTHLSSKSIFEYADGYVAARREKGFAYGGVSGEVGFCLWENCNFILYGAAGPYYFKNKDFSGVKGGCARLELRLPSNFTLETIISHDSRFKTQIQGIVSARFSIDALFGCSPRNQCIERSNQPVKRNGLVAFFKRCCDWDWNW